MDESVSQVSNPIQSNPLLEIQEALKAIEENLSRDFIKGVVEFPLPGCGGFPEAKDFTVLERKELPQIKSDLVPKNLIFAKSVSSLGLTLFAFRSKKLAIFDRLAPRLTVEFFKSPVVCLDFDEEKELLMFVMENGKIQFANWQAPRLMMIGAPLEMFKVAPARVKMIHRSWLILAGFDGREDEVLVRLKGEAVTYESFRIAGPVGKSEVSATLACTVLSADKDPSTSQPRGCEEVSVVLAQYGVEATEFWVLKFFTEGGNFASFDPKEVKRVFEAGPPGLGERSGETRAVAFGEARRVEGLRGYAVEVWGGVARQYEISKEVEFRLVFVLEMGFRVKELQVVAGEVAMLVADPPCVHFVDLAELGRGGNMKGIQVGAAELAGGILISDLCAAGVEALRGTTLISVRVLGFGEWWMKLKGRTRAEKAESLLKVVAGHPPPLIAALGLEGTGLSRWRRIQAKNLKEEFGRRVGELAMGEQIGEDKEERQVEFLQIRAGNFDVLFGRAGAAEPLFSRLAFELEPSLIDSVLAGLCGVERGGVVRSAAQNFFFFLAKKFDLNPGQLELMRLVALKQGMGELIFWLVLAQPYSKEALEDFAMAARDKETRRLLFSYLLDVFKENRCYDFGERNGVTGVEVKGVRRVVKDWVFAQAPMLALSDPRGFEAVLSAMYARRRELWADDEGVEALRGSSEANGVGTHSMIEDVNEDDDGVVENCDHRFDAILASLCGRGISASALFVVLRFVRGQSVMSIRRQFVTLIIFRVLSPDFISQTQSESFPSTEFSALFFEFFSEHYSSFLSTGFNELALHLPEPPLFLRFVCSALSGRHDENFELAISSGWFFRFAAASLRAGGPVAQGVIEGVAESSSRILALGEAEFVDLATKLPSKDLRRLAEGLSDRTEIRFDILKRLARGGGPVAVPAELRLDFLELICRYEPRKVVDFLENFEYDANEALKICKAVGEKRGLGYLKYRIGEAKEALSIYKELISSLWSLECSGSAEQVLEALDEASSFRLEENTMIDAHLDLLIFVDSQAVRPALRVEATRRIFGRLFSAGGSRLAARIEAQGGAKRLASSPALAAGFLLNFDLQTHFNFSVREIFSAKMLDLFSATISRRSSATKLEGRACSVCGDNLRLPLLAHRCGSITHIDCLPSSNTPICPGCLKAIALPASFSFSSHSHDPFHQATSFSTPQMNNLLINATVYEKSTAQLALEQAEAFKNAFESRRGLGFLDINHLYFTV